jgi:hypothetical protein
VHDLFLVDLGAADQSGSWRNSRHARAERAINQWPTYKWFVEASERRGLRCADDAENDQDGQNFIGWHEFLRDKNTFA